MPLFFPISFWFSLASPVYDGAEGLYDLKVLHNNPNPKQTELAVNAQQVRQYILSKLLTF